MRSRLKRCGHCALADSVRAGTAYKRQIDGVVVELSKDDALARLARLCRCDLFGKPKADGDNVGRVEVKEIRRPGQRILYRGTNVRVQLRRRPGTRWTDGHVIKCFDDNTVEVFLPSIARTKVVTVDEFIVGRRGRTKV